MVTYADGFVQWNFRFMFMCFITMYKTEHIVAFSVDLYHRYSSGSPFYDPNLSETEIIRRIIARSVNESRKIISLSSLTTDVFYNAGEYLMKIRLGTPPVDIIAAADTGSDLTWTQCQPCTQCFPQKTPLFNPQASSTYAKIPCRPLKPCPFSRHIHCRADGFCHHDINYGDKSYSEGFLSTDTIRIDSTFSNNPIVGMHRYVFGCGTNNGGTFGGMGSGVIGLGPGPQSFLRQVEYLTLRRFSYCLIPFYMTNVVSHIRFGHDARVNGPGTVTIPQVYKFAATQYFVTLEAFTVGKTRIKFIGMSGKVELGNIIIDTGATLMAVPRLFYDEFKRTLIMQMNASPVPDPDGKLDLCYKSDPMLQFPNIVANFRGGDVPLKPENVFLKLRGLTCLAFHVENSVSIFGFWAQQGLIVGYEGTSSVSFKPFDCTKF